MIEDIDKKTEITLVKPSMKMAEEHFRLVMKNKRRLGEYLAWAKNYKSIDDSKGWIESAIDGISTNTKYEMLLMEDNKIIGCAGFNGIEDGIGEIGYWIDENYEGKGIIREAVGQLIKMGFEKFELKIIRIQAQTKNTRSNKIPLSLGFEHSKTVMDETGVEFNIYELSK